MSEQQINRAAVVFILKRNKRGQFKMEVKEQAVPVNMVVFHQLEGHSESVAIAKAMGIELPDRSNRRKFVVGRFV